MAGEKATAERTQADEATRRRRPSGEPAPLPKEPLAGLGWLWVLSLIVVLALIALLLSPTNFFLGRGAWWNSAVLDGNTRLAICSARREPGYLAL